ncbi:hypothetical protein MMC21_006581 [Puttea exsequens]|nr:hypothetical protein [Puttea exsequens]
MTTEGIDDRVLEDLDDLAVGVANDDLALREAADQVLCVLGKEFVEREECDDGVLEVLKDPPVDVASDDWTLRGADDRMYCVVRGVEVRVEVEEHDERAIEGPDDLVVDGVSNDGSYPSATPHSLSTH